MTKGRILLGALKYRNFRLFFFGQSISLIGTWMQQVAILQTIVDDDKRGRVMSFYAMAFLGAAPLGSLLAGSLATHLGVAKSCNWPELCVSLVQRSSLGVCLPCGRLSGRSTGTLGFCLM